MKHIKSYEDFLLEAEDRAKEIESKINKMGEVKDKSNELEADAEESKAKTDPRGELGTNAGDKVGDQSAEDKSDEADIDADASKDAPKSPEVEVDVEVENESTGFVPTDDGKEITLDEMGSMEGHEKYDDRLLSMGLGDVLAKIKEKDPAAYKDIEGYLQKNFTELTTADESWFTTMTS